MQRQVDESLALIVTGAGQLSGRYVQLPGAELHTREPKVASSQALSVHLAY